MRLSRATKSQERPRGAFLCMHKHSGGELRMQPGGMLAGAGGQIAGRYSGLDIPRIGAVAHSIYV